jgi:hypothetical protein
MIDQEFIPGEDGPESGTKGQHRILSTPHSDHGSLVALHGWCLRCADTKPIYGALLNDTCSYAIAAQGLVVANGAPNLNTLQITPDPHSNPASF